MDHFKGIFPSEIEIYLYSINDIGTSIKVSRDMVQSFNVEIPSKMGTSSILLHIVETVPEEKNKKPVRTENDRPKPQISLWHTP